MGNFVSATIMIVLINVAMWFTAIGIAQVGGVGACYNVDGTVLGNTLTGTGNSTMVSQNITGSIPKAQEGVISGVANIFTDIFNNILSWFQSIQGVKYLQGIVTAPSNILSCMGLPAQFTAGLGALWYLVCFLIFIAFLWGRGE